MDQSLKDVLETVNFIKDHMLTKDDVRDIIREEVPSIVREETKDLGADVRALRQELEELKEKVENVIGYRKEIDHALERIAAIEKHLGIEESRRSWVPRWLTAMTMMG